ncbi:armadillo-type protein [Amylocystis lapponica]|nr:armadillo-type protein [Amylocystis lapponica]
MLKFHEKLVGKGLSTDALQKKLKALHTELADMDQELVEVSSLSAVRKELISTSILLHKDRGVKAYVACCLADLLRLYAPDAPYTHNELRDIFQFFFRQLSTGLKGSDSPYYNEYFHLLESLSTVKSVVLVCDLPNADELMADIFRDFFGLVRRDLAKKIELFMADILIALIDECQNLPSDVLESIMAQFMDKNARMDQPAYRLAVQYFTDIIVQHSRDEEFDEVRTAHDLIKQLNRSCPSLLHNVVPQLEEELRVEENQIRIMATQVLGEMFADKGGADFVKKYPTTWSVWLLRKNDKASVVRLAFVEATKGVLVNLPDAREAIEEALGSKLLDPDEKVRAAVCKLYSQLDYETALHHVSEEQLRSLAGRGLDKKQLVRVEAMTAVGHLYGLAYPEIENNDPAAVKQFSWIPSEILHMATSAGEARATAEQVLAEYVLPLPSPPPSTSKNTDINEGAWTDRLLNMMKFLDEAAINTLLNFSGLKALRPTLYEKYLQCCIDNNGGIIDDDEEAVAEKLNFTIKRLAAQFPDPQKAAEDLSTFAKLNEGRLYKLLKTATDTQVDLKVLVKSTNEFLRRTEQASAAILPTMTLFLRRASLRLINQSSVPTLVKRVQKGDPVGDGYGSSQGQVSARNAQICMNYISKYCPAILKVHVSELSRAIADEKNARLVEVSLQALAAVASWDSKLTPSDKRTVERVMRYVMSPNARHAKFSARLISCLKNAEELCGQIVDAIAEGLPDADPELLVAHITVLQQLALRAPDAFERKSDVITTFLVKDLLMSPSDVDADAMQIDTDWVDDSDMTPRLKAKLLALKVCRNRCLAHASSDTAVEMAKPVLRMFTTLLHHDGSFTADAEDDQWTKTRLRLQSAISLLHLNKIDTYASANGSNFVVLAVIIQDPSYPVRMRFIDKLTAFLIRRALPSHFNVIPFLTVHDPEADVKNKAKAYISCLLRTMPKGLRLVNLEMTFLRLLHVLAHHPDFALTEEKLPEIAQYITFYLETVASAENVALLFHLAMKAKTVRDAESHAFSENLYAVSELAQHLIKTRAKMKSWSIESYPGKIRLPPDILRPLPGAEAANEILKTVYLPENTLAWLAEQAKIMRAEGKEKPRAERKPAGKRKAAPKTGGQAKRARRRKAEESDEEESPPSESGGDDEEASSSDKDTEESESEQEAEEPQEEKLGRGARTRAKARIKQQVKKSTKRKAKVPLED